MLAINLKIFLNPSQEWIEPWVRGKTYDGGKTSLNGDRLMTDRISKPPLDIMFFLYYYYLGPMLPFPFLFEPFFFFKNLTLSHYL